MNAKAILRQVKQAIRQPYAWPGGYPVYTILADGDLLCANCTRKNFRRIVEDTKSRWDTGWKAAGVDVYWEGEAIPCGHCGKELESAYGPVEQAEEVKG